MTLHVCLAHGPDCKNVLHVFGPVEVWEERRDRRRLMRVAVANHFLTQILNGSFKGVATISSNLPNDAQVIDVRADPSRDCLVVWVRSQSFEVVEESHEVPELFLTFSVTTGDIEL